MYWPIGTPRIYATTTTQTSAKTNHVVSHDGIASSSSADNDSLSSSDLPPPPILVDEKDRVVSDNLLPPFTPGLRTPATPAINSVEHDIYHDGNGSNSHHFFAAPSAEGGSLPTGEPVVALKVSRTGHLFAVITASSMTIWQTKVRAWQDEPLTLCADFGTSL